MFYSKNVSTPERILRVLAGLAMVACGLIGLAGVPLGLFLALAGGVTVLTGFVGFCPMCAMVGRRLPSAARKKEKGRSQ
jgi:hypothetical protein